MKRFLCIFMAIILVFSAFSSAASAYSYNSNFISSEKDFGEVYFDCGYAEIGKELAVSVSGREGEDFLYKWYIDGKEADIFTRSYTPQECDLQSMLEVEVYDLDGVPVGKKSMFVSLLPVVYIETQDRDPIVSKEDYIDSHIRIQGNAEFDDADLLYDGVAEIRGRGNSTWMADKKPYRIKLDSKADLFGMGKSKHWVLLSNPFDSSVMRNTVSYNFSADLGLEFQKSVWVEVILNGTTMGNYSLCEHVRVDDTRVDITNWEDLAEDAAKAIYNGNKDAMTKDERDELIDAMTEDMSWTTSDEVTYKGVTYSVSDWFEYPGINGGYLTEVVRSVEEYTFATSRGMYINVDTPEALSADMLDYISGYYQAFEDALFSEDFCTEYNGETVRYTDLIDVQSFVGGFIVNEIFENYDFGRTSTWISQDIGGKLVYGPIWDMDHTVAYSSFFKWSALGVKWIGRMLSDPVFLEEIRKEYWAHRYTDIQDLIRDGGDIDTAIEALTDSAEYNDGLWANELSFIENATDFKLRLQDKINWLDTALSSLASAYSSMSSSISNINYVNSSDITLSLDKENNSLGIKCKSVSPASVSVFVDGKKVGTVNPTGTDSTLTLPKLKDGAVISVVAYDADMNVIAGKALGTQKEIASITINALPSKLTYNAGEALDLTGLVAKATYTDGTAAKVDPDLAYTYIKDPIGEQFFAYNSVTKEIGEAYIVLCFGNKASRLKITVNPRDNSEEVEALIAQLPSRISGNAFVSELFEAQTAYDALSESAKAEVDNYSKLSSLMNTFITAAEKSTNSVVACFADGAFRTDARSTLVIVSKDEPNKISITSQNNTSATYTSDSAAYLSAKKVGAFTLSTIKHTISADTSYAYKLKAIYPDNRSSDSMQIRVYELMDSLTAINSVYYSKHIFSGEALKIVVDKDTCATGLRLLENGENIGATVTATALGSTLTKEFNGTGKHTLTLQYLVGTEWLDNDTFDVFVHEKADRSDLIYHVIHPEETYRDSIPVKIITDEAVGSVALGDTELTGKTVNGYKIFTADADITDGKEYILKINGEDTDRIIRATILDPFEIEGTKIIKFLANTETAEVPEYITEIADDAFDGFEGTIYCYPGSAAEAFAEEKGIKYVTFKFNLNLTSLRLRPSGGRKIIVTASPYMPEDFVLNADYDSSVVSFDGNRATGVAPGYTRLKLSSACGLWSDEIRIYVNGGVTKADLNADGKINSIDALIILQATVGNTTLDSEQTPAADVNGDGKINSIDALIILQISTGKRDIWDYIK
ncbi:MAG: CotH kinase family protein [Clostridia bacterium]|nr:CotH kinase family protein [Clostridia bacterium]